MRAFIMLFIATFSASMPASEQSTSQPGSSTFFLELTERRAAANVAQDRGYYEYLLSEDFVIVADNGVITSKKAYLDSEFGTKRPKGMEASYAIKDFKVVTSRQGLAVVSYIKTEAMKIDDQTFSTDSRCLDTYATEDRRWRLVAMAAVAIVKPPMP